MSNINDFVIEKGVLTNYTGNDCTVIVPDSVKKIGSFAFENCSSLEEIIISDSVSSIGESAFDRCASLLKIVLPKSLKTTSLRSFYYCQSLTEVHAGGVLSDGVCKSLNYIPKLKVIVSPLTPFANFKKNKLALPATIGYLTQSEKYGIGDQVPEYEKYIVSQQKQILPIVFEKDLVEALYIFDRLKCIKEKNVDSDYFASAEKANARQCIAFLLEWKNKNVSATQVEKQLKREATKDPFNVADMKKIWSYDIVDGSAVITSYKGSDTVVIVPERIGCNPVTAIGIDAFSPNKSGRPRKVCDVLKQITEIVLPEFVTSIQEGAFAGCQNLKTFTMPDTVTNIGKRAFAGCEGLTHISISKNIETIGESAFYSCEALRTITIPDNIKIIEKSVFGSCKSLQSIVVPHGVTHINTSAFSYCTSLTKIELPDSVISIGKGAFEGCCGIADTDGFVIINNHLIGYTGNDKFVVIPESVNSIGEGVFSWNFVIESVKVPKSVKVIEDGAFSRCSKLKNVEITAGINIIEKNAFYDCKQLENINLPETLNTIGGYAFYNCTMLEEITIGESVEIIGEKAFYNCEKLSINCKVESKPDGWDYFWNEYGCPVNWGC